MKHYIRLFLIVPFLFGMITTTHAQYVIGANNGSNTATSYPAPIFDYFKTSRSQYLYLASELTAAGMSAGFIDELSWTVAVIPAGTGVTEQYTLKLLATTTTSLTTTGWESGASLVWGPADYTPVIGENLFTLESPFYWNGTDNLIVEVCGGDDNIEFTKNVRCVWTGPLAFNASRTYASDTDTDPCSYAGPEFEDAVTGGYDYRPQVIFGTSEAINCSDLPIIGTTFTSSTEVCAGETFLLSIGAVAELGISYQWYSSTNALSWTIIPGANEAVLATTQDEALYYLCSVSCAFSGDNSNSTPVFIDMRPETECYCTPSYVLGSQEGDFISNVTLGDINNTTGALVSPYYNYYSDLSTDITSGQSYTISITCGSYESSNGVAAWIDFNRNGVFDADEKLGEATGLPAYTTSNFNFIVPATAVEGVARLRVRDVYDNTGLVPCGGYEYGEAEDYNVMILPGIPPEAAFIFTGDPTVSFTDLSTGDPLSWNWAFGDGAESTEQNPVHTYIMNGVYSVCLTATSGLGSNTLCQDVTINSYLAPAAAFSYTGDPTFNFSDLTANDPETWAWDFGDGGVSTEQNPAHTYLANGTYTVCLYVTNITGDDDHCENVVVTGYPAPIADFSFSGDPTVDFIDLSTNDPETWLWDFGDGTLSGLQNPTHTFLANGTYNVCLTVSGAGGLNTGCQDVLIDYYGLPPTASYTYTIDDYEVSFTDVSTNSPTDWLWDFGDGEISGIQNPVHAFDEMGLFTVCLIASNEWGDSESSCQELEIFPESIQNQIATLEIYPNPAHHNIFINTQVNMDALMVLDLQGRQVSVNYAQTVTGYAIQIAQLPAGTYQVLMQSNQELFHAMFVKD